MTRLARALAVGPRVYLRPPVARDEQEFIGMVRESRAVHRPWVTTAPDTPAAFGGYLARGRQPTHERFLVCARRDDGIAGVINLSEIARGALQSAYAGYYGSRHYAGQGLVAEGFVLALGYAFRTLRLHRVEANVQPGNAASLRLVERCGLRKEGFSPRYVKVGGRWRDHERWAVTVEDWPGVRAALARLQS